LYIDGSPNEAVEDGVEGGANEALFGLSKNGALGS
jgi:hypothetical protein